MNREISALDRTKQLLLVTIPSTLSEAHVTKQCIVMIFWVQNPTS